VPENLSVEHNCKEFDSHSSIFEEIGDGILIPLFSVLYLSCELNRTVILDKQRFLKFSVGDSIQLLEKMTEDTTFIENCSISIFQDTRRRNKNKKLLSLLLSLSLGHLDIKKQMLLMLDVQCRQIFIANNSSRRMEK